jgi:transcriptional regulator with XRE-family HTH domain
MTIGQRVRSIWKASQMRQEEFCLIINVSRGMLNKYFTDENKPGIEVLESIIKTFPEINSRWLLTGEGEMLSSDTMKSGSIQIGKTFLGGSEVNEQPKEYKKPLDLERENSRLKDKFMKTFDDFN